MRTPDYSALPVAIRERFALILRSLAEEDAREGNRGRAARRAKAAREVEATFAPEPAEAASEIVLIPGVDIPYGDCYPGIAA